MTTKFAPQQYFWIIFIALLVACGALPSEQAKNTPTTAPTFTPIPQTPTVLPTKTPLPMPLPLFPLDGYIVIFNKDGDLYFQDGNNSPVQLTHGGEVPSSAMISDDNTKIVFVRGNSSDSGYSNIYSVNADGSDEQALITEQWLATLGEGTKVRFPVFVPDTHQLLFNTYLCESQEFDAPCSIGIFLLNADTGEIRQFLAPAKAGQYNHNNNFKVSPNGKLVSVVMSGHLDIFGIDGKVVRKNVLPYTPSTPIELSPVQYWLPDSSGLIVALPAVIHASPPIPDINYTVWRYAIDGNAAVQISLDPSPKLIFIECGDVIKVSPDGNWILYGSNETGTALLYFGNLSNGQTQFYAPLVCPWTSAPSWSPDSKHFVYGDHFLGSIDESSIPIGPDYSSFGKWIDATHYTYVFAEENALKLRVGEMVGETILTYDLAPYSLIKPK
jgi:WD40 repeat protein